MNTINSQIPRFARYLLIAEHAEPALRYR